MASFARKEEEDKGFSLMMMVAVCKEKERTLEFLMKMSLVVFESFLQRPKDVVFEGLSEEGLVMEVENGEEDKEEEERM